MGVDPRTGEVVSLARRLESQIEPVGLKLGKKPRPRLSFREAQALDLIAMGLTNKEISEVMIVSPETVKTYVSRLFRKLEVNSRMRAFVKAIDLGLLSTQEPPLQALGGGGEQGSSYAHDFVSPA